MSCEITAKISRLAVMKNGLLWIVLSFNATAFGQTILIFDLENGTVDSMSFAIDPTLTSAQTGYYVGNYSGNIAPLTATFPSTNTFPQSEYALKRKVEIDYSINDFPIRAATKTFRISNGEFDGQCSGTMISRKHVLTAAHCQFNGGTNDLMDDSISVCPAYNNGLAHPEFGCSEVAKVYVIRDWNISTQDFAILELKESLGYQTGWLGIGFEEDSSTIVDRMYYKFSYPSDYIPQIDPNVYNGDTLYYNYGKINYLTENSMGVMGGSGIPGESGSPLIHVVNNQDYTIFGTFTFISNMTHVRIKNATYHALFSIIEDDLSVVEPMGISNAIVYPNPATKVITVDGFSSLKVLNIQNSMGQAISNWRQDGVQIYIDELGSGIYFLFVETEFGISALRFVKEG